MVAYTDILKSQYSQYYKSIFLYIRLDLKLHGLSRKFISKLPGKSREVNVFREGGMCNLLICPPHTNLLLSESIQIHIDISVANLFWSQCLEQHEVSLVPGNIETS